MTQDFHAKKCLTYILPAQAVREEVQWVTALYDSNPAWLQLDVTLRSVEETAARILRELSVRYGDEHPMLCKAASRASG